VEFLLGRRPLFIGVSANLGVILWCKCVVNVVRLWWIAGVFVVVFLGTRNTPTF